MALLGVAGSVAFLRRYYAGRIGLPAPEAAS
jgi:hypothetical protein